MKPKSILNSFLVLLLSFNCLLPLNSCKKVDENAKQNENVKNFENPYNKFGVLHNELLKELYQEIGREKVTHKEIVKKGIKLLQRKGCLLIDGKQHEIDENLVFDIVSCLDADLNAFFIALNEKGYLNEKVTQELRIFSNDLQSNTCDVYQLERLNQFELNIANNSSLDIVDKELLLGYVAIDRSSTEFWNEQYKSQKGPFAKWVIAAAVAASFAIGMAGGNPVLAGYLSFLVSASAAHKE